MKIDLTSGQRKAIDLLAQSSLRDIFYWTGGTLLSYHYLHHRKSLDIDFFSASRFSFEDINHFAQTLKKEGGFRKVSYQKIFDRFEFLFENGEVLRVEFVYYNDEKKQIKERGKLLGIVVDSLEDVAANKVMAYLDRNEPKDLFDIYFLLTKGGFTPQKLLVLAAQKFGVEIPESLFWSEAFKSLPLLSELAPLLDNVVSEKKELFRQIEVYFKDGSSRFLRNNVE